MFRGLLLILLLSMLLPSCWRTGGDCKPSKTARLHYPKSFETTREMQADGITVVHSRVKEYTKATITISLDQIARTEPWVPHESPAALSLSRAIELAEQWVARKRSDDGGIKVSGTYLARYGCQGQEDYWYYGVRFSPFSLDGELFEDVGATVAVLMDGTVIGPVMVR